MANESEAGGLEATGVAVSRKNESPETLPLRSDPSRTLPVDDAERLGELLGRLQPRLTAVALRFTKDPEIARDVVQSAFEKVVRHGVHFQGQSLVSTWVHRIVINEALMWLRTQRRRAEVQGQRGEIEDAYLADTAPGPGEEIDRRLLIARLREGIARLCGEERDVLMNCALAGLSYAEYGTRTGTHPAALKSRAFRARRHLGTLLQAT
jgi:RNA polymerase sigma-70 factor (ECF subfamily)